MSDQQNVQHDAHLGLLVLFPVTNLNYSNTQNFNKSYYSCLDTYGQKPVYKSVKSYRRQHMRTAHRAMHTQIQVENNVQGGNNFTLLNVQKLKT